MILFLDPDPKRAALAYQRMNEEDQSNTIWCKTFEEGQTTLWNYRDELTEVHMEHDLSGTPYMNTRSEESGMELVRYLERLSIHHDDVFGAYKKMEFTIHTWNDHAGPIMVERLRKIGLKVELKPFGM
jgi:hypothetical protein